jgi:hypothetical protein
MSKTSSHADTPRINGENGGRESTYQWTEQEHDERPEALVVVPDGPEVDGAPRPHGCILLRKEVGQQPRLRQRHEVSLLVHLEDVERPLHQRDDPPVMEIREDAGRVLPCICQVLQRGQRRI